MADRSNRELYIGIVAGLVATAIAMLITNLPALFEIRLAQLPTFVSPPIWASIAAPIVGFTLAIAWYRWDRRRVEGKTLGSTLPFPTSAPKPPTPSPRTLVGRVVRFEILDARDLTPADYDAMDKSFYGGKSRLMRSDTGGPYYGALLELDNRGERERATAWDFSVDDTSGKLANVIPQVKTWRPTSWPELEYLSLERIKGQYLETETVYHIVVTLLIDRQQYDLDLKTFAASFSTISGDRVKCVLS